MSAAATTRPPRRERLDRLLVERGLAPSRERAQALVLAGRVRVDGRPAAKPGVSIPVGAGIEVTAPDHPYVGRGGVKLAGALDRLGIHPAGRLCLDLGASTGGFTDCLLQRGAARVVALDVGAGQLDWGLRNDPRVEVVEGVNARHLAPGQVPGPFDLVVVDVSFISLRLILPVIPPRLRPDADVIALVKPQFEVGRDDVGRGGIVREPRLHRRALETVAAAARDTGLRLAGGCRSPIEGAEGNREFFLHLKAGGRDTISDPAGLFGGMTDDAGGETETH